MTRPFVFPACLLLALILVTPVWSDVLVVHKSNPSSTISEQLLSQILTLKRNRWPNKQRVEILLPRAESEAYSAFIVEHLGIFPYQLRRHWKRANFSGRASPPLMFDDIDALVQRLITTPGAIAFIPEDKITSELQRVQISN